MANTSWSVIIPEASTNMVINPSPQTGTTGYTAVGGSIAQSATRQRRGVYSLKVTPTSATGDGVYYGTVSLVDATTYTFSVDVWAAVGVPIKIYFADTSANLQGTATTHTGTGAWVRLSATYTASGSANRRLYVIKNNSNSTADFWVDGFQVEAKAYATTYLDGSLGYGYSWASAVGLAASTAYASQSSRSVQARSGGRERNLSTDYGLTVRYQTGIGMPPLTQLTQPQTLLPGAFWQGSHTDPRSIVLLIVASGSSLDNLHTLRAQLIAAVKPDATTPQQPLILRYYGEDSTNPLEVSAYYESGLEFQQPESFRYDQIPLRLTAYDPFLYRVGFAGAVLSDTVNVTTNNIAARINSAWTGLDAGVNNQVLAMALDPLSGSLYVAGEFTTAGSGAATVNYVAKWTAAGAWVVLATTLNDGATALAVDAVGGVYVGGDFTAPGEKIIYWNGTAFSNVYAGVGFSAPDRVFALVIGPDGYLYAGGSFATIDGTTVNGVAKWTGSAWVALGSPAGVGSGDVNCLAFAPDGNLYAGGTFLNMGGVAAADYMARWDGSAWYAVGSLGNSVNAIAFDTGGNLYATGTFTTGNGGATTLNYISRWNGASWEPLSTGLSAQGLVLAFVQASNLLYVGGTFGTAGGVAVPKFATWNGTSFAPADITLPGSATIYTLSAPNTTDLYVGGDFSGTATASGSVTVTTTGTANAYPKITIKRSGGTTCNLISLRNETTGKTIWFDYSLRNGEELRIDLRLGRRMVESSFAGANTWGAVLRSSDFSDWALAPGANVVTLYATTSGSPTVTATILWRETYWSADA